MKQSEADKNDSIESCTVRWSLARTQVSLAPGMKFVKEQRIWTADEKRRKQNDQGNNEMEMLKEKNARKETKNDGLMKSRRKDCLRQKLAITCKLNPWRVVESGSKYGHYETKRLFFFKFF